MHVQSKSGGKKDDDLMSQHDSRYSTDVNNKFDIPDVIGENFEQLSWFSAVTHQPSE